VPEVFIPGDVKLGPGGDSESDDDWTCGLEAGSGTDGEFARGAEAACDSMEGGRSPRGFLARPCEFIAEFEVIFTRRLFIPRVVVRRIGR